MPSERDSASKKSCTNNSQNLTDVDPAWVTLENGHSKAVLLPYCIQRDFVHTILTAIFQVN